MAYDFSTLNDKDFEQLTLEILNSLFALDLQSFKTGRDQGIDLRFSSSNNSNEIVVQAKHFIVSGYRALVREIKKERKKVIELKPGRYIIVTSLSLSAKNKDEIRELLMPFLKTSNDVFGREDLNKYLTKMPDIEKRWYKLWISSTTVFNKILHNATTGRSSFVESNIKRTIQLYVHSSSYDEAFDILKKFKYILITGQPGVGKTTLAYLLTFYFLSQKHKLVYIDSDVKDAEDVFSSDPKERQLFFFDDFLGANYLETINPKTSESKFVAFLDRVKNTPNKYLILTTRTIIFRNALSKFEKLKRVKVDIARKEIELGHYSALDRARILYNHIYHSKLGEGFKKGILREKGYWRIIKHRNYNPRLIEFISDPNNSITIQEADVMKFIMRNLDNPGEVWKHAYEQQMNREDQILLHSVFSQPSNSTALHTQMIFDRFLEYEVRSINFRPALNPFTSACRNLLDGILKREVNSKLVDRISFINPSITDFLTNYFLENGEERWKLIKGSIFIEQFEQYVSLFFDYFETRMLNIKEESSEFANYILDNFSFIKPIKAPYDLNENALRLVALLNGLITVNEITNARIDQKSNEVLEEFDLSDMDFPTRPHFVKTIKYTQEESKVYEFVLSNWTEIVRKMLTLSTDESDFTEIRDLFNHYNQDFDRYIKDKNHLDLFIERLSEHLDTETRNWFGDEKQQLFSEDDWSRMQDDYLARRLRVYLDFGLPDVHDHISHLFDMEEIREIMSENSRFDDDDSSRLTNKQENSHETHAVEEEIETLFVGHYDPNDPHLPSMADVF